MRLRTRSEGRVLGFDLESAPSAFWYDRPTAEITAFGWKWIDEPDVHYMLRLASGRFECETGRRISDGKAYRVFYDVLTEARLAFGHNIRNFDFAMVNAGLLRRNMPVLKPVLNQDTLKDYPKRRDMSASLENLAKLHLADTGDEKLHMAIVDWERANKLNVKGIELAKARVTADIVLQEKLRESLLELEYLSPPKVWSPR